MGEFGGSGTVSAGCNGLPFRAIFEIGFGWRLREIHPFFTTKTTNGEILQDVTLIHFQKKSNLASGTKV